MFLLLGTLVSVCDLCTFVPPQHLEIEEQDSLDASNPSLGFRFITQINIQNLRRNSAARKVLSFWCLTHLDE